MIDPARLPSTAALDTGVLIRALGDRPEDPRAAVCREFVQAMLANRGRILVPAPVVAEMLRGANAAAVPRVRRIVVVPFDDRAAVLLGTKMPEHLYHEWRAETGRPVHYFKYDALIVACAQAHGADCIVHLDGDIGRIAEKMGFEAHRPDHFEDAQFELDLSEG